MLFWKINPLLLLPESNRIAVKCIPEKKGTEGSSSPHLALCQHSRISRKYEYSS